MRRAGLITGILLLAFNGLGAVYGGCLLILDPSGQKLGLPVALLSGSPFRDYLVPGIFLLAFNGASSLFIAGTGLAKSHLFFRLLVFQGIVLGTWLAVQIATIRYVYFLHYLMGAVSMLMMATGLLFRHASLDKRRTV